MESTVEKHAARKQPDAYRRNYSDEQIQDIYRLGKLWLELGHHKRAEALMSGLNEVAPDFAPAWLGTSYLRIINGNYDGAFIAATNALRLDSSSAEAMLFIVTVALNLGDVAKAGTFLGEVREAIEGGMVKNQSIVRFYKMQLARYENRGS